MAKLAESLESCEAFEETVIRVSWVDLMVLGIEAGGQGYVRI
jgi:hypothetical protein